MSDASHGTYRTLEEVEENKKHDPLCKLRDRMEAEGLLTDDEFTEIEQAAIAEVEDAAAFAEASPDPALDELYTDLYHD